MNIALLGHGNMGKEIERLLRESGRHTYFSVEPKMEQMTRKSGRKADVVIDVPPPESVHQNI